MQDDIFNPYGIDKTLKVFIEQVEESKLNCFLIENRKKWG